MLSQSQKKLLPIQEKLAFRVLDANFNRGVEGLRVVEEYARFVISNPKITLQLKQVRHQLCSVCSQYVDQWASQRNSQEDVGSRLSVDGEYERTGFDHVVAANLGRVGQALRALEEYSKVTCPEIAPCIESLRYSFYEVEKDVKRVFWVGCELADKSFYVLTSACSSQEEFQERVENLCTAGVDLIQLREKNLDDVELLARAKKAVEICSGFPTLLIINDRPDVALMSGADGVHVGQEEFTIGDIRGIFPPNMLIGVSTHSLKQAIQAEKEGADYVGVGPTFKSNTKCFTEFKGTELLTLVSQEISIPAFAIGGINLANLSQVVEAGFRRVAVSSAVHNAESPHKMVVAMKNALNAEIGTG